ncbi:unnamed protein product [Cyclocybe aegerita]|uniref:Uncharacterized protein n=1 Tax=Cyclocybe aegerita TaxID=1973307 RepID=A0A8S0VRI0_CYCAE|nr:unnamed protein product [Cyclocybe aegerita]
MLDNEDRAESFLVSALLIIEPNLSRTTLSKALSSHPRIASSKGGHNGRRNTVLELSFDRQSKNRPRHHPSRVVRTYKHQRSIQRRKILRESDRPWPFVALFKPDVNVVKQIHVGHEACHSPLPTMLSPPSPSSSITPLGTILANEREAEARESATEAGAVSSREKCGGGCRSNFVHVSGENEWEEDLGQVLAISTSVWEVARAQGGFSNPAPIAFATSLARITGEKLDSDNPS